MKHAPVTATYLPALRRSDRSGLGAKARLRQGHCGRRLFCGQDAL